MISFAGCGKTFSREGYLKYHIGYHCSKRDETSEEIKPTKSVSAKDKEQSALTVHRDKQFIGKDRNFPNVVNY